MTDRNMKKNIYVKPETTVVLVETEAMMVASPGDKMTAAFDNNSEINTGRVDAKRNGNSLWDFDED